MDQLDARDAGFLYAETGTANANVSLIQIYDQTTAPGGRIRFKSILAHVAGRLHLAPRLRQRLLRVPLELDHPYWVEDEHFDLEYHVRHIALPRPGDWRQFCIQASRIHARALDLQRPLWEIYVIEGLDGLLNLPSGSFALLVKMHHAAIDLEHSNALLELLHDTTPIPRAAPPAQPWFPDAPPGPFSMLARGLVRTLTSPFRLAGPMARVARRVAPAARALLAEWRAAGPMPVTRFNAVVSAHRVFETRRFAERDFAAIARQVPGATVDDVLLAVCGGGVRRYLQLHGELPAQPLHALVTATGSGAERGPDGTEREPDGTDPSPRTAHPAWQRARLGCEIDDPAERLRVVVAARVPLADAGALRALERAVPAPTLAFAGKVLGRAMHGFARHAPFVTCTIAAVGGPAEPQYLIGARMTYFSAILPISDGMGLVLAVSRYDGQLIVSPTSCRELMPDPEVFAQCLRDSFQETLARFPAPPVRRRARRASAGDTESRAGPPDGTASNAPPAAKGGRRRSTARAH